MPTRPWRGMPDRNPTHAATSDGSSVLKSSARIATLRDRALVADTLRDALTTSSNKALLRQRVDAPGVAGGDHGGDPTALSAANPERAGHLVQRFAEARGGEQIQLCEPVGVGGVQQLVEWRQLECFGEYGGGPLPDVRDRQAEVDVHVRMDVGQIRRLAVVRV